jgi:manganese-dependent ADP-ribose/CDP-alcohol diphosphatase
LGRDAVGKLEKCLESWNANPKIQFAVQLGDIIDGNETEELTEQDMAAVVHTMKKSEHPLYHVIGNHCLRYNGGKDKLMAQLKMERGKSWYRFHPESPKVKESGHVFLVLDGTDISLNKWDEEDPKSKMAREWLENHSTDEFPNAVTWNGAISSEQLEWFEYELKQARANKSRVFVFCHYPILADHLVMAISLLWNAPELVSLLDRYSDVVVGWFSGHYHHGGAQLPSPGTHSWAHITVEAILIAPEQSFGVVDVHENGIIFTGTGSCSSHRWLFPELP